MESAILAHSILPMKSPELEQVAKKATRFLFSTPLGRGGLVLALGTVGTTSLLEAHAQSSDPQFCVQVSLTPDTMLNDGNDAAFFEAAILDACRPGLLGVKAILDNHFFTIDGKSPRELGDMVVDLQDNGMGGDRIAGDGVYTSRPIRFDPRPQNITLTPYEGINGLYAQEPFHGLKLHRVDGLVESYRTPRILVLDKSLADIQTTPHIINMRDDLSTVAKMNKGSLTTGYEQDLKILTRRLYDQVPGLDPWHFLLLTTNSQIFVKPENDFLNYVVGGGWTLRRDFTGAGGFIYFDTDRSQQFGSQDKLRQLIFTPEPLDLGIFFHELIHWPAAYLYQFRDLNEGGHWKANTSMGGVVSNGLPWVRNRDGTFTTLEKSNRLSKLEQYLLGLIYPEQVPLIYVALNTNQDFGTPGSRIVGEFKEITIQDIIAKQGLRTPGPGVAPSHFDVAYVFTTKGREATQNEKISRELIAQRIRSAWGEATEGKSSMELVTPPEPGPAIIEPLAGKTLDGLGTTLRFTPNANIKQFQVQVIPFNNDGPGINLIIGAQELVQSGKFIVSPPEFGKGNYVMLPGMSYTWRIRTTSSTNPNIKEDDPSWSAWSKDTFRTGNVSSETIKLLEPATPIRWENSNPNVFYYEVQVSEDPTFNTDPQTTTAAVYWNLVHGGVSNPPNSWTAPEGILKPGTTYHYRVRPRVQGNGTPVAWTPSSSLTTPGGSIPASHQSQEVKSSYTIDRRYSVLKDNPTPDAVLYGQGSVTYVFSPQKERYVLAINNF